MLTDPTPNVGITDGVGKDVLVGCEVGVINIVAVGNGVRSVSGIGTQTDSMIENIAYVISVLFMNALPEPLHLWCVHDYRAGFVY